MARALAVERAPKLDFHDCREDPREEPSERVVTEGDRAGSPEGTKQHEGAPGNDEEPEAEVVAKVPEAKGTNDVVETI